MKKTGFMLSMLIFPTAESGSALLDLSFTSRIVIEIDDTVLYIRPGLTPVGLDRDIGAEF